MNFLNRFANKELVKKLELTELKLNEMQKIYGETFSQGFSSGLETAVKMLPELSEKTREAIRSKTITETLKRMNGKE